MSLFFAILLNIWHYRYDIINNYINMAGFENAECSPQQELPTVTSLRDQINSSVEDSKLTIEESDELRYNLDSAIDNIQSDTFNSLKCDIRERAQQWINIASGTSSERAVWNYLWVDLHSVVNFLKQDGYNIPENYSIRDNGTYLVFHDESGKDIATMNWETKELWWGGLFVWNDDTSDNYNDINLDAYAAIMREDQTEEAMNEVENMRQSIFDEQDGGITLEDALDYQSLSVTWSALWLSGTELRNMIIEFQRQAVTEWYSPYQEELWRNIRIYKMWENEVGFSQHTTNGEYFGVYDKQWIFQRWWTY